MKFIALSLAALSFVSDASTDSGLLNKRNNSPQVELLKRNPTAGAIFHVENTGNFMKRGSVLEKRGWFKNPFDRRTPMEKHKDMLIRDFGITRCSKISPPQFLNRL
jgi:hypothetical protein